MKRLKKGFTLAEVLITLAIIGIVSAIILPSVMANYQYKSIGVKLGKFVSTVEGAARAFVVNEANFNDNALAVQNFVNESFIIKQFEDDLPENTGDYPAITEHDWNSADRTGMTPTEEWPVAILKDGTGVRISMDSTPYENPEGNNAEGEHVIRHADLVPVEKYGVPAFRIDFNPNVQGLPSTAQKVFSFTVTELGYVFPHEDDDCTWELYQGDFNTTSRTFAINNACYVDPEQNNGGESNP